MSHDIRRFMALIENDQLEPLFPDADGQEEIVDESMPDLITSREKALERSKAERRAKGFTAKKTEDKKN